MELVKACYGKMIFKYQEDYIYVDSYSYEILKRSTLEECETEFNKYVEMIMNRD